jgi:hypothetical protein
MQRRTTTASKYSEAYEPLFLSRFDTHTSISLGSDWSFAKIVTKATLPGTGTSKRTSSSTVHMDARPEGNCSSPVKATYSNWRVFGVSSVKVINVSPSNALNVPITAHVSVFDTNSSPRESGISAASRSTSRTIELGGETRADFVISLPSYTYTCTEQPPSPAACCTAGTEETSSEGPYSSSPYSQADDPAPNSHSLCAEWESRTYGTLLSSR